MKDVLRKAQASCDANSHKMKDKLKLHQTISW